MVSRVHMQGATNVPPVVPMSGTTATLREPGGCPRFHSAYHYRVLRDTRT